MGLKLSGVNVALKFQKLIGITERKMDSTRNGETRVC